MNEAYRILAASIVYDAIKEWRTLLRRRLCRLEPYIVDAVATRVDALRTFFRSPWCDVLLCGEGEGEELLARLEAEYQSSRLRKQMDEYQKQIQGRQTHAEPLPAQSHGDGRV